MKTTRGFTLIEVMIAVVVVAIIAAIAFPTYQDTVRKSRRTDAKVALLGAAQTLERCFTEFNAYNNVNCLMVGTIAGTPNVNLTSDEGFYTIDSNNGAETLANTSFTLTATPVTGTSQASDLDCAMFSVDNTGAKNADNSGGTANPDCWR